MFLHIFSSVQMQSNRSISEPKADVPLRQTDQVRRLQAKKETRLEA